MQFYNSKNEKIFLSENHKQADGFTLIEIMIAMVIFLIVTVSIYNLLQVARVDRNRSIGRDALNAGLGYHKRGAVVPDNFLSSKLGIPADANPDRDILTSIVAGNNIYANNLQPDPAIKTDMVTFAFRDLDFNAGEIIELQNVTSPSDRPQTAILETKTANGAVNIKANDLYLIESDTSQVAVSASGTNGANQIDISPTDPLNLNQPILQVQDETASLLRKCVDSSDTNCMTYVASLKRFFLVKYYVKPDGTFVRTVYGNNRNAVSPADQIQEFPLAYNVENLQIKYVLKDGTVTENPSVGADGIAGTDDDQIEDFNLIRQITVTLTVQSYENDEQTGKLDKIQVSATFSMRNMDYDAG